MSVETEPSRIAIASKSELVRFVPFGTAAFIGSILSRRELQASIDIGYADGEIAGWYLGKLDDRPQRIQFYVGHIGDKKTQATHILKHVAFKDYLINQPQVKYDELGDRFIPKQHTIVDLSIPVTTVLDEIALYRVEDHHDMNGAPGVISYLSPDYKQEFDEMAIPLNDPAVVVAKRLIGGA